MRIIVKLEGASDEGTSRIREKIHHQTAEDPSAFVSRRRANMKKIILAPDSFKGTMTAAEICAIQEAVIRRRLPTCEVRAVPLADGGEGMTEAFLQICGGQRVCVTVTGPLGAPVEGFYGRLPDGTAVIEMAAAAGLPLAGGVRTPLDSTTWGVGELIRHAAGHGAERILLGLGGSATNDGGVGMAAALGWRFYDGAGAPVEPLARNLGKIASFRLEGGLPPAELSAACDVDNPLCGPRGATAVFGPQKGVTPAIFPGLEAGMCNLARVMERQTGRSIGDTPGAGAAGGLGAGVLCFLNGTLERGIDLLLDAAGFDQLLEGADLVLTGEGCMDGQSVYGKTPAGVAARCQRRGVPCVALCGALGEGAQEMYRHGITAMFSTLRGFAGLEQVRQTCRADMEALTDGVMRLLLMGAAKD